MDFKPPAYHLDIRTGVRNEALKANCYLKPVASETSQPAEIQEEAFV